MRIRICNFPECGRKYRSSGLCDSHLKQKKRGKELAPLGTRNDKPRDSKVCRVCGEEKVLTEFRKHCHGYRIGVCRECEPLKVRKNAIGETKVCRTCGAEKKRADFNTVSGPYVRADCRICQAENYGMPKQV